MMIIYVVNYDDNDDAIPRMQWEHSATGTVIFDGRMQMSGPDLNLLPPLHCNDDDDDDDDDNERERYNI